MSSSNELKLKPAKEMFRKTYQNRLNEDNAFRKEAENIINNSIVPLIEDAVSEGKYDLVFYLEKRKYKSVIRQMLIDSGYEVAENNTPISAPCEIFISWYNALY